MTRRKTIVILPPERSRNPLHDHPLLHKGGAHGKTRKAERRQAKVHLRRELGPQSAAAATL